MRYSVRHAKADLFQINLVPETKEEHQTIQNANTEYLKLYYHEAVKTALGHTASLLLIIDDKLSPYSVIGKIKYSKKDHLTSVL